MVLGCVRFKVATKHRKCQCSHVFSAPPIFKSGLKPRYLQVFCCGKGFCGGVAQSDGTYTGFCTFLPQNPVYWDGFKLCTLQSDHKTP